MSNGWNEFARLVASEICPCDNCPTAEQCKAEELACKAFQHYTNTGRFRISDRTRPDNKTYVQIFKEA